MFFHNLKYTLITLFKTKVLIFWNYAFPIILGTLFYFAFSNIESNEKLNIIDIAIVENENFSNNEIFKETFSTLGDKNSDDQLFNITYTTEENAKELLNKDKVTGYLLLSPDNEKVIIKQNGINETIFKYVVEEVIQTKDLVTNIVTDDIAKEIQAGNYNVDTNLIAQKALELVQEQKANLNNTSNTNLSYTMIEFYTLIAMACLYGAMFGMFSINKVLPNMSSNGKRVAVSKIKKWKLLSSNILAAYIVQLVGIALLFIFTIFVLNIDYGTKILPIIILSLVGSLAGLTFGIAVGSLFKSSENTKLGVILTFTMLGVFLSGMMGITMKYIVDTNVPIVNKLNPANMITDGFYSLYYYTGLDRYYVNVISLSVFAIIMIALSFIALRRQKYDSI